MGRPKGSLGVKKTKTAKKDPLTEKDRITCVCCLKSKIVTDFYMSKSTLYAGFGRLPICKDCLDIEFETLIKRYSYEPEKAIYYLCMRLDYPYISSLMEGVKAQSEKLNSPLHRVYIQKINSMGSTNNYGSIFLDGEILKVTTKRSEIDEVYIPDRDSMTMNGINEKSLFQIEVDEELLNKWGGFPPRDIVFLETEYQEWVTRYDISSKSMEILVKEICHQQLAIKKKREGGHGAEKELKSLQELMGNTALKPVQESAAQATDAQTFGTLIRKWENEKPIPKPDKEFEDVDGIKKYLNVWFFGHLCRMLGIENDYSRQYDEETLKHSVNTPETTFDFPEEDQDGDKNVE